MGAYNLDTMFSDVNDKVGTIAGEGQQDTKHLELRHIQYDKDIVGKRGNPHSRA